MKKITLLLFILSGLIVQSQDRAVLNLANDDDFSSFSFFDSLSLENYNLFFTGEDHRYPLSNSDLELKMFKYLHKNEGVRVFMVEFGQGMGYLMNKYINGDDSIAERILEKHSINAYFNLFENLKEFNQSLPDKDKFTIQSVDIEREPLFAVKVLESLLPNNSDEAHDSIKIHLDAIKAVSEYYDERGNRIVGFDERGTWYNGKEYISPISSMKLVITNFETHKEKYQAFLKDNYKEFSQALSWIEEYNYWRSLSNTTQKYLYRETYMENNVKTMFSKNPNLKAYGQFGRCHTQLQRDKEECNYYYFNALATRLNKSSHPQLKGKVFSCPIFYPSASSFFKETQINKGLKEFTKKAKKNKIMVFEIDTVAQPSLKVMATRFNAVIINNLGRDKSEDGVVNNNPFTSSESDYYWNERLILLGEAGVKGYNLSELNTALGVNYNNLRQFIGFSINFAENYGFNASTIFHWFPSNQKRIDDSTSTTLAGFSASMRYSKDVLKKDHYDLNLGIGYGFERWKNTIEEEFADEQRRDIFGNNRTTQYTNPAFIMDAGFNFRIHASWVTFGFFGRYQLDFSNRKWRLNNVIVPSTPKLSLNAYTLGFSLGLNLEY
jgi:hypothetical protein